MTALLPCDLDTLKTFQFDRVLSQSSLTGSAYLLGTLHGDDAIVHVQRTAIDSDAAAGIVKDGLESLQVFLDNRPYFSAHALLARGGPNQVPDLSLKLIWPATSTHIRKYTAQARVMITETPAVYASVVAPYIASFPPDRLGWVYNILSGAAEAERVLYRAGRQGDKQGFVVLPDLKWDGTTLAALYLTVIVDDGEIKSMRDLTKSHIGLLVQIKEKVYETASEKYGVGKGQLRLFVHYQPSYYHFHVHVVHVNHEIMAGMAVGQAHLLDDIISLLEISPPEPAPSILAQMTLTYAIGTEHGLYEGLMAGQTE